MTPAAPATQPIAPIASGMPAVVPFKAETHQSVLGFLGKFDIQPYLDSNKTHKEVTTVKRINIAVAGLLVGAAACAYYKVARQYSAIALAVSAAAVMLTSVKKEQKPTKAFADFSASCKVAVEHMRNAFASKAKFMVDQVTGNKNGWTVSYDSNLSKSYDDDKVVKHLDLPALSAEQVEWRAVQAEFAKAVQALVLPAKPVDNALLQAELDKVAQAKDIFLFGQTPAATLPKDQTYIQYLPNKGAAIWPSAAPSAVPASAPVKA